MRPYFGSGVASVKCRFLTPTTPDGASARSLWIGGFSARASFCMRRWAHSSAKDDRALPLSGSRRPPVNPKLLARHVASTFVLVLHWWLDHDGRTASDEADKLFRALVMPVLRAPL
jgi:hypothetical protein